MPTRVGSSDRLKRISTLLNPSNSSRVKTRTVFAVYFSVEIRRGTAPYAWGGIVNLMGEPREELTALCSIFIPFGLVQFNEE
ncbi:hypothetical protein ASC95_29690 [Pelomonas sp. Root1217]|nr:hypothetical protein ASC95_29690 [Pelomonas sp. Root1217]